MAAVVDQHIDERNVLLEALPERPVGLVSDVDVDGVGLVDAARLLDVDTMDRRVLTEVALPHLEAAAAVHADLDDDDLATDECRQVPDVEVEVVAALVDAVTFAMRLEVRPQSIRLSSRITRRRQVDGLDVRPEAIPAGRHRRRAREQSRDAAVLDERFRQPRIDRAASLRHRARQELLRDGHEVAIPLSAERDTRKTGRSGLRGYCGWFTSGDPQKRTPSLARQTSPTSSTPSTTTMRPLARSGRSSSASDT